MQKKYVAVNLNRGVFSFSSSPERWPELAENAGEVTRAVESLLAEVKANAPWQKHCEMNLSLLEQVFANFNHELREMRAILASGNNQNYQSSK